MIRIVFATVFFGLIQCTAFVHADDQAELADVLKQYTAAFNSHDAVGLSKFYAEETDVIHGDNVPRKSRKEMLEVFTAFFKANPNAKTAYTDIVRTPLAPNLVIESGVWNDSGLNGGKSEKGRYTAISKKMNGNWLTIYERGWKTPDADQTKSK